jgi:hypothetical protein
MEWRRYANLALFVLPCQKRNSLSHSTVQYSIVRAATSDRTSLCERQIPRPTSTFPFAGTERTFQTTSRPDYVVVSCSTAKFVRPVSRSRSHTTRFLMARSPAQTESRRTLRWGKTIRPEKRKLRWSRDFPMVARGACENRTPSLFVGLGARVRVGPVP